MTTEKFANLAETTLASSYTAGAGSISVTSAALFPTTGTFSIRLDNVAETILRVTAVSGTTFTVTAEANDGNASAGDAVVLVGSRKTAERFLQSPESGEARAPSGILAADYYGPIHKLTALSQSSWSWLNQGSAAFVEGSGLVYITSPTATGTNLRGRHKSMSGITTVIMGLIPGLWGVAALGVRLMSAGILLRESGTGELTIFGMCNFLFSTGGAGNSVIHGNYNSATSFNAVVTERLINYVPPLSFLRLVDSGGNLTFSHSLDGVNWFQFSQVSRTSFMAGGPDQIGWYLVNQASAGGLDFWATIPSWVES